MSVCVLEELQQEPMWLAVFTLNRFSYYVLTREARLVPGSTSVHSNGYSLSVW